MFSIEKLIEELSDISTVIDVGLDDEFDFNKREEAFVIESGTLLSFGSKKSIAGVRPTQTFGPYDPIGFAEAIAGRSRDISYKQLSDLKLHSFREPLLKSKVNSGNVFAQTIIKYSLGRIFDHKKSGGNILLEDEFIYDNYKVLGQFNIPKGEPIFNVGDKADVMYFIEKGGVGIFASSSRQIADLNSGDCFGEAALIKDRARNYSAVALKPTRLVLIERDIVKRELERDHPIVRLSVILLLKRLELMNKLNLVQEES